MGDAFIKDQRVEFNVSPMCRVLRVQRSQFYKWLLEPKSKRQIEDEKLTGTIKHFFAESDGSYGSPRIHRDLQESGIRCGRKRVERLMRQGKIRAARAYKKRRWCFSKPGTVSPNRLGREFSANTPNEKWATDITQIQTYEGWLYVAIVEDLFSRVVVGWST